MLSRGFFRNNIDAVQLLRRSGRLNKKVKSNGSFFSDATTCVLTKNIPILKNQRDVLTSCPLSSLEVGRRSQNVMIRNAKIGTSVSSSPATTNFSLNKYRQEGQTVSNLRTFSNFDFTASTSTAGTDIRHPSKDMNNIFMDKSVLSSNGADDIFMIPFDGNSLWDSKKRTLLSHEQDHAFQQYAMESSPLKVFANSSSFQRARVDYPEMSFLFYTTMRNVTMNMAHNGKSAHVRKIHSYNNWNASIMSLQRQKQQQQQQYRTFASSTGPSASTSATSTANKDDQSSPASTSTSSPRTNSTSGSSSSMSAPSSSSNTLPQQASKPQIPVPSPVVHDTPLAVKVKHAADKAKVVTVSAVKSLATMIAKTPGVMWYYITHPKEFREKLTELKELAKKEAHHYYMGSKLLMADIKTARQIVGRTLNGTPLTRRERKQLIRTVTDVFRLVPMSIFVLIPFMEFALPFALKLFPNMLPSTFQDSLKAEENMKRELKSRLAMAEFFQETLHDLAKDQKRRAESSKKHIVDNNGSTSDLESTENREETAASFLDFIEKARNGEFLPPEVITRYAKYFKDELTLDNMPRMQLINMCRYMGIPPYGNDNVLRFQLRHKVRGLIEDDQRILWEGIDSLTKMELREACQERGMRSTGLSKEAYKRALQQWIDLSVNRNVPISLLVMSRTFFLQEEMTSGPSMRGDESKSVTGLADAISGLDKELVNEVILESVSNDNKQDPELLKLKLQVLQAQNELIEEEKLQRDAEAARAEKERAEKERAEKERAEKERAEKELKDNAVPSDSLDKEKTPVAVPGLDDTIIHKDDLIAAEKAKTSLVEKQHPAGESKDAELKEPSAADEAEKEEEERSLSSEELDAISQLVSPDPVSAEREKLLSLKAALQKESQEELDESELQKAVEQMYAEQPTKDAKADEEKPGTVSSPETTPAEYSDKVAEHKISSMDEVVKLESDAATQISFDGKLEEVRTDAALESPIDKKEKQEEEYSNKKLDMAISRLKSKVESMVGNLEIQLSDVESKIGDKLHFLDKDMDGILSREEMAICLQSVLKRPLTFDEAMAIAADMDENEDGFFSLDELSKWLETNKLVKLVEEGRHTEVDKIIETQAAKMKDSNTTNNEHTDK